MTIAPPPGTIIMPPGSWIPNISQITDTGAGLLAVMGRALDDYGLGDEFKRRVYTHGDTVPLFRGEQPTSQLIVTFTGLELGEAGQKQFQWDKGAIGQYAHMVGGFQAEVWVPWPLPTGGIQSTLADDLSLMEATDGLNQCTWVVFSALRALSLAGIRTYPPVTPIAQDKILIGPATPVGPDGGLAGFHIDIQVEYD